MDESRGLERLAWPLLRQLLCRQAAKLVVNERQQLLGAMGVAFFHGR
jgi:hypothetical protein